MPTPPRGNILILALSQALMLSAIVLSMALAAILGAMLAPDKGLATLPVAAMVIGTKFWFLGSLLLRARADNLEREAGKDWVRQRAGDDATMERRP